jgi:hypothetical protein
MPAKIVHEPYRAIADDFVTLYSTIAFPIVSLEQFAAAWSANRMEYRHYAGVELPRSPYRCEVTRAMLTVASAYLQLPTTVALDAIDFGLLLCYYLHATQPNYILATTGKEAPATSLEDEMRRHDPANGDELADAARRLMSRDRNERDVARIPITPVTMRLLKKRCDAPDAPPFLRAVATKLHCEGAFDVALAVPLHTVALTELVRSHARLPRPLVDSAASSTDMLALTSPAAAGSDPLAQQLAKYKAMRRHVLGR